MVQRFYESAIRLDLLKVVDQPDEKDTKELTRIATTEQLVNYFFHDLDNPNWVVPLNSSGWFKSPPMPFETQHGIVFPRWAAGEYLKKVASKVPEAVLEIAMSLKTENTNAIHSMLEALIAIPTNYSAEAIESIELWSKISNLGGSLFAQPLGKLMRNLAKNGEMDSALRILDILVEPIPVKRRYEEGEIIAGSNHDLYWLNYALNSDLPALLGRNPVAVAEIFETRLLEAIDLEVNPNIPREGMSAYSYWRMNIRLDLEDRTPRDLKNLLVNALIRALEASSIHDQPGTEAILARLLKSQYVILKRIAIHALRYYGDRHPTLVENAYQQWLTERGWNAGYDEFEFFLDERFEWLSLASKQSVIRGDYLFWKEGRLEEWAEDAVNSAPDRFHGDTKEQKVASYLEENEFRHLHYFARWLKGDDAKRYEELSAKYEKPGSRQESGVVVSSWEGEQSPIKLEELGSKTIPEVVQYLIDFVPDKEGFEGFRSPSREGLSQALEADIKTRPQEYIEHCSLFIREDLRFLYQLRLLSTFSDLLKGELQFDIEALLDLCSYVVQSMGENYERTTYEPGLSGAKMAVARLLEQFLRGKEPYADERLLNRIEELLLALLDADEPELKREEEEPQTEHGMDVTMRSLNSIRGIAMHALFQYALYSERKRKADGGDPKTPVLVPAVEDALNAKLDDSNLSLTEHSVMGWYFPQLIYLNKEWALKYRERIFPVGEDPQKYWLAAWRAYVFFSDVYTNVFPHLIENYKVAIQRLPLTSKERAFDRMNEHLADHILKAYLLEMIEIESDDGLVAGYYNSASDEVRSHGNFWLSQVLNSQQPGRYDKAWQRIWQLWQWRLDEVGRADDKDIYQKEMTSYSRLLPSCPAGLDELYPVLIQIFEFKSEDHFEFPNVIEYLAKNAEIHLGLAVDLLLRFMRMKQMPYLLEDDREHIRQIFEHASNSGNAEAKRGVIEMINLFGEWGDYDWREWLSRME